MERRITGIIYVIFTFALVNEISINVQAREDNKRRTKEKNGGFQKNICDVTDRDSKIHCYCENTREPKNATKAECWVFNGGIPREDSIWQSFESQPYLQSLSFNVRVDGALSYVPTKAFNYLQHLKSINIKYGNIVNVTQFSFANMTDLNEAGLSQNQIENLQQYAFAHLPNITTINLEDNMIIEIDAEAFFYLPKLEKLVLTKNNISMIRNGTFKHTYNLLQLDLNKNNLSYLNRRTFDGLTDLKKLDLRQNRIHNLTEFTFAELWNLQELLLGKNDLKFISERAFDGLSLLQKLFLDENKLVSIPSRLFEGVRNLNSLDLRSNELQALTLEDIKPILDNLRPQNSILLLEENNFVCDCRLKWMYALRNETKSQVTIASLDGVTCKMNPSIIISSAYSEMPKLDGKVDYNQDILHAGITIETRNEENNATSNKAIPIKEKSNINTNNIATMKLKRNILKMAPEILPCRQEKKLQRNRQLQKTTEALTTHMPLGNPLIPIHNKMKTFDSHGMSSGQAVISSGVVFLWKLYIFNFFSN